MTRLNNWKRGPKILFRCALACFISLPATGVENDDAYELEKGPLHEANGVVSYYLSSDFIDGECRVQILRPEQPTNRILYLLPVTPWPGFEEKWSRRGSGMAEIVKHDFHNRFGYTVVVPDFPNHMPWFVDHETDPKRRHESYMIDVIVPFTDQVLGIEEPVRDLLGFSKGGFGSLSLLLRHPDIFHAASVWDTGGLLKSYDPENTNGLSDSAGGMKQFERYQLEACIPENAAYFRGSTRIAISGYSNEAFQQRLHALRDILDHNDISYSYSESVQVPHRWYSGWLEQAFVSLQQMQMGMTP